MQSSSRWESFFVLTSLLNAVEQTTLFNEDFEGYPVGTNLTTVPQWSGTYNWTGHVSSMVGSNALKIGGTPKDASLTTQQTPYLAATITPQAPSEVLVTTTFEANIMIPNAGSKTEYFIVQLYNTTGVRLLELWFRPADKGIYYKSSTFASENPTLVNSGFKFYTNSYFRLQVNMNMRDNLLNCFINDRAIISQKAVDLSGTIDRSLSYFTIMWLNVNPSIPSTTAFYVDDILVKETKSAGSAPYNENLATGSQVLGRPLNSNIRFIDNDGENMIVNILSKPSWVDVSSTSRILQDRRSQMTISLRGTIPSNLPPENERSITYEVSDGVNTVTDSFQFNFSYAPVISPDSQLNEGLHPVGEEFEVNFTIRDVDSNYLSVLFQIPLDFAGTLREADGFPIELGTPGYAFSRQYRLIVSLPDRNGLNLNIKASDETSTVQKQASYVGGNLPQPYDIVEHKPVEVDPTNWDYPVTMVYKFRYAQTIDTAASVIPSFFTLSKTLQTETDSSGESIEYITVTLKADPTANGFNMPDFGVYPIDIVAVNQLGSASGGPSKLTVTYKNMAMFSNPDGPYISGLVGDEVKIPVQVSPFAIAKTEFSESQYQAIMAAAPNFNVSIFPPQGSWEAPTGDYPLIAIKWSNAILICNTLSLMEGLDPVYYSDAALTTVAKNEGQANLVSPETIDYSANGYRLPTEAEWEIAARANLPITADYPFSNSPNEITKEIAAFGLQHGSTIVSQFQLNEENIGYAVQLVPVSGSGLVKVLLTTEKNEDDLKTEATFEEINIKYPANPAGIYHMAEPFQRLWRAQFL